MNTWAMRDGEMDKEAAEELAELNILLRQSIAAQEKATRATHGNGALLALLAAASFGVLLHIWRPSNENLAAPAAILFGILALYKLVRSMTG
jgi:hypothetical protein